MPAADPSANQASTTEVNAESASSKSKSDMPAPAPAAAAAQAADAGGGAAPEENENQNPHVETVSTTLRCAVKSLPHLTAMLGVLRLQGGSDGSGSGSGSSSSAQQVCLLQIDETSGMQISAINVVTKAVKVSIWLTTKAFSEYKFEQETSNSNGSPSPSTAGNNFRSLLFDLNDFSQVLRMFGDTGKCGLCVRVVRQRQIGLSAGGGGGSGIRKGKWEDLGGSCIQVDLLSEDDAAGTQCKIPALSPESCGVDMETFRAVSQRLGAAGSREDKFVVVGGDKIDLLHTALCPPVEGADGGSGPGGKRARRTEAQRVAAFLGGGGGDLDGASGTVSGNPLFPKTLVCKNG